ncbi:MAG: tRNA 2-thiocytidine(32) synthetase TtcA [Candidatus Omnitrophica bacterium]|nr:tRNA 2-thiocytidine(32) synthetase TtcA [Candidatus Omnitrophota bacterium]
MSKTGSYISKKIGQAIGAYDMIADGDRILVAVSGGKDSFTLLKLLRERQRWAPVAYTLHAAYVETENTCDSLIIKKYLARFCTEMDVTYTVKTVTIDYDDKKTNCFWCSWNKRKILFDLAQEIGYNKIALGHHKDDIVETVLLNMFFVGNFSTMNPKQELFEGKVTLIRPLVYCEEKHTEAFAKECDFPFIRCGCAHINDSNRQYIKQFISEAQKRSPDIKENIFNSMNRIRSDYIDIRNDTSHTKSYA